jgi:hypothetical protein
MLEEKPDHNRNGARSVSPSPQDPPRRSGAAEPASRGSHGCGTAPTQDFRKHSLSTVVAQTMRAEFVVCSGCPKRVDRWKSPVYDADYAPAGTRIRIEAAA